MKQLPPTYMTRPMASFFGIRRVRVRVCVCVRTCV